MPTEQNSDARQCVFLVIILLQGDAKFHSFLYTGSRTARVSIESCYGGMSTRLKQRAVTEFLSAENVTPAAIHRRLQAVYGENTVNRTTVNRWTKKKIAKKFKTMLSAGKGFL